MYSGLKVISHKKCERYEREAELVVLSECVCVCVFALTWQEENRLFLIYVSVHTCTRAR